MPTIEEPPPLVPEAYQIMLAQTVEPKIPPGIDGRWERNFTESLHDQLCYGTPLP